MILGLVAAAASFEAADAQPGPEYAWCAAASKNDGVIYYSDVFDVLGLERDVSGQWYGLMQYHYRNIDLASARCFISQPDTPQARARAERDQEVEALRGGLSATPSTVDTHWVIQPYG
jgi:hypothetical protein